MKESRVNENTGYVVSYKTTAENPNLRGDRLNFILLILLYIIQGFPIGLSIAFPLILQKKPKVDYDDQAVFSITSWPFSFKLLWAPIIDALYVQMLGRRKSWLLPIQFTMGFILLFTAFNIDDWLPENEKPNLTMLVIVVFAINFLSATQDIVVDGWSLTMMKKRNVGYASTSNSVGLPIGMFLGSVCFTLLVSEESGETYLGKKPGTGPIVTMKSFFYFWAILVISMTVLVGLFKKEKDNRLEDGYMKISVFQNYKMLWNIFKLPNIRMLALALITAKIGFVAMEMVTNLKLVKIGVPSDKIMIITTMMYSIKITIPIFVTKYITGPKPMSYYLKITPFRLLWSIAYMLLVFYTPSLIIKDKANNISMDYYLILGFVYSINEMLAFFMLLALNAFFCRLSDPRFGGTYMTLFSSFYYCGFMLSNTIVLKSVNYLSFKIFVNDVQIYVDGYYTAMVICVIAGFIWYGYFKNTIKHYQSLGIDHWSVNVKHVNTRGVTEPCVLSTA